LNVDLKIRPDIRYPACTGYPAAYPVSGFKIGRISGIRPAPDIRYTAFRLAGYPAKSVPVSGASLQKKRRHYKKTKLSIDIRERRGEWYEREEKGVRLTVITL
jgi:hypothetical protein